jgi:hypothetical protein
MWNCRKNVFSGIYILPLRIRINIRFRVERDIAMYTRTHYKEVLEEAKGRLAGAAAAERARACGWNARQFGGETKICMDYLGKEFLLDPATLETTSKDGRPMPLLARIVALHYLLASGSFPISGELVSLRKIPELECYGTTIKWRTEDVLVRAFGARPGLIRDAAVRAGGSPLDRGDAAVRLFPLPRVPMVIVINGEEDGIPAAAAIFYDRSVTSLLPLEDAVVLAELVSHKLANISRENPG